MPYIFSTLAADMDYTNHVSGGADLPIELPPVRVNGGAGVADKHFVTPRGVLTEVTDEEMEYLQQNPVFKVHVANGFIQIETKKADPEKVAADMSGRDPSAPLVPGDLADSDQPMDLESVDAKAKPSTKRK